MPIPIRTPDPPNACTRTLRSSSLSPLSPTPTPVSSPTEHAASNIGLDSMRDAGSKAVTHTSPPLRTRPQTFFFPFYQRAMGYMALKNRQTFGDPFVTYAPSLDIRANIQQIWNQAPIVLDSKTLGLIEPLIEPHFQSALFRIPLSCDQTREVFNQHPKFVTFEQGTTIVFKGEDTKRNRYIVEHCQWVSDHQAYLLIVGITLEGRRHPFDHPRFPSFILTLPTCHVDSSSLPSPAFRYVAHDAHDAFTFVDRGILFKCDICVKNTCLACDEPHSPR